MSTRERGIAGEDAATVYLSEKGYTIIERNFHSRWGEIDIIAARSGYIVFAEVKLRAKGAMVSGMEAVNRTNMRKIYKTALRWLYLHPVDAQPRFDVIEITDTGSGFDFTHIENAFGAEVCNEIF